MISRPIVALGGLIFGPIGLAAATWAVLTCVHGKLLTALVYAGVSAFCLGLIVPYVKVVPGRVSPRVTWDGTGTTVCPDRGIDVPVIVSLSGLVVATGVFAVCFPLGVVRIPVPHELRLYLPFIAGATALMGAPIALRAICRGCTKYLRLMPDGFEIVQGWRPVVGRWSQIVDVTDSVPDQAAVSASTVVILQDDEITHALPAGAMTPGGRAVREWVRFYWTNAALRAELTDGRAQERLQTEDFTIPR